jgi:hypothetical protein
LISSSSSSSRVSFLRKNWWWKHRLRTSPNNWGQMMIYKRNKRIKQNSTSQKNGSQKYDRRRFEKKIRQELFYPHTHMNNKKRCKRKKKNKLR